MASFLIVYGTSEGQTEKIAKRMADELHERGHQATPRDVREGAADLDLTDFDAVLVGSSIHVGKQQTGIVDFVAEARESLSELPTGFFQVSLTSATDDEERQAEAAGYVEDFVEDTDFHPDRIAMFGGALAYSKYGFLKRLLLKRIARDATGDTDTSRDYEYTDWDEVESFTADFAAFVEGRLGLATPDSEE